MTGLIDWDAAFENGAHIPGGSEYPGRWQALAADYRATAHARFDLPYGPGGRERFDLFLPDGAPKGLAVFVHGGYWKAFDKSTWSHLAQGAVARGWAMALPSYTLAPEATLAQMTAQIARAVAAARAEVPGPVRLAGHSAGGHLVARMLCADQPDLAERAVSISGLHDLRPLLHTKMNDILCLTPDMAQAESPALQPQRPGTHLTVWVGGHERPEFLRQSALMREAWPGTRLVVDGDFHHFNVISAMADPASPLTDAILQDVP
ncbi:MAG: CE10 family esterase [Roseibaca calidilacus]|uniref:Alpha/beta hydrolase family protein n=1 Tax=Roseibaca calidilacus TaxID=1666912 RepID=A0A0P7W3E5_9RHOB|nr:alpha/beta hydrolase [Roseibaca calidilacus]KPP90826.1 MAG: CE10 family esterase [Roseibaca calidilacus]CUX83628.1 Alpha/beta hydrolase family protein [Roseibaca calidilacus]